MILNLFKLPTKQWRMNQLLNFLKFNKKEKEKQELGLQSMKKN